MKTTIQCVAKTLITLVVCTFITASISQPAFAIEEPNEILIGDVEVTKENAGNIVSPNIAGAVSFDYSTNTLTLNNANIQLTTGHSSESLSFLSDVDINIFLIGENRIDLPVQILNYSDGANPTLVFEGSGSLLVNAPTSNDAVKGNITVNGATVTLYGGTNSSSVISEGDVTINSGSLAVFSRSNPILKSPVIDLNRSLSSDNLKKLSYNGGNFLAVGTTNGSSTVGAVSHAPEIKAGAHVKAGAGSNTGVNITDYATTEEAYYQELWLSITEEPVGNYDVTEVDISLLSETVAKGGNISLLALVKSGEELYSSQAVTWTLSGNSSSKTQINFYSVLQIAADETANALTLRATSNIDPNKHDEITINVVGSLIKVTKEFSTQHVTAGETINLSVEATGPDNILYEWYYLDKLTLDIEKLTSNTTSYSFVATQDMLGVGMVICKIIDAEDAGNYKEVSANIFEQLKPDTVRVGGVLLSVQNPTPYAGSGINYDAATNTLTLENAEITGFSHTIEVDPDDELDNSVDIYFNLYGIESYSALNIVIKGENTIHLDANKLDNIQNEYDFSHLTDNMLFINVYGIRAYAPTGTSNTTISGGGTLNIGINNIPQSVSSANNIYLFETFDLNLHDVEINVEANLTEQLVTGTKVHSLDMQNSSMMLHLENDKQNTTGLQFDDNLSLDGDSKLDIYCSAKTEANGIIFQGEKILNDGNINVTTQGSALLNSGIFMNTLGLLPVISGEGQINITSDGYAVYNSTSSVNLEINNTRLELTANKAFLNKPNVINVTRIDAGTSKATANDVTNDYSNQYDSPYFSTLVLKGDVVGNDRRVTVEDLLYIAAQARYNTNAGANNPADLNKDGKINFMDLAIARESNNFGK